MTQPLTAHSLDETDVGPAHRLVLAALDRNGQVTDPNPLADLYAWLDARAFVGPTVEVTR